MADIDILGSIEEWIEKANEIVHNSVKECVARTVEQIVETAKELAPVDTGNLRDNIVGKVSSGGHYGKVRIDSKKVYYAFMVHFGTTKQVGRPFLYQASEQHQVTFPE